MHHWINGLAEHLFYTVVYGEIEYGESGHLSIFTLLKHLMMLLKYKFYQGFIFTPYQRHW